MSKRAAFAVYVAGTNISSALSPVLLSLRVSDSAGAQSGSASIEVDDTGGQIVFPETGAEMRIFLGWEGEGVDLVFDGFVDDVRSRGNRGGGRTMSIDGKEVDTKGKAKEGQQKHFDDKTVKDILTDLGKKAGITDIKVDDAVNKTLKYFAVRAESFMAAGQRLAKEVGGTFKIVGKRAVMKARNEAEMPTITAAWGSNLRDWDIAPQLGRPRFKKSRTRYYDRAKAKWVEVETETEIDGVEAAADDRFDAPDEADGKNKTKSAAKESERNAGEGSVTIEGNTAAQPEGICVVAGARPGVDGPYRIDSVEHSYSRSGFETRLGLKKPDKSAGTDTRS